MHQKLISVCRCLAYSALIKFASQIKKKMKKLLILALAAVIMAPLAAQNFMSPAEGFSRKKTSYVTLTDGTEIEGTVDGFKRKKGLFKLVKIKDESGKIHELEASAIKHMYLMPNGLDKLNRALDAVFDVQKWSDENMNSGLINDGYAFFEMREIMVKKEKLSLMLQLLNPGFSKRVKVYHDPYAAETMSAGIGGVTLAGGLDKSYYIGVDGGEAYRLAKKTYKKTFSDVWKACPAVYKKYTKMDWSSFVDHIISYTECE